MSSAMRFDISQLMVLMFAIAGSSGTLAKWSTLWKDEVSE